MNAGPQGLDELSPFQLKDRLIRYARAECVGGAATHKFLNAGRGNPNWVATTPREAFFLLGQFALAESKRVWDERDIGGMPDAEGIASRFAAFLASAKASPGSALLHASVAYCARLSCRSIDDWRTDSRGDSRQGAARIDRERAT